MSYKYISIGKSIKKYTSVGVLDIKHLQGYSLKNKHKVLHLY